jgi:NodT family efflux transporter outer membrane factor (OMF) lipoprotein
MKKIQPLILLLCVIAILTSCNPFRPKVRKSPESEIPRTFSLYSSEPRGVDRWWESFQDEDLDALVEEALSGNFNLQEAWARLRQAQALVVQVESPLYPDLNLGAEALRGRQSSKGESLREAITGTHTIQDYFVGLVANYELDLWGRIRSEREAARFAEKATREDVNTAAMSVAAEVAQRWVNIVSQRMQRRLLQKQLEANLTYLELVELRFRKSMVSALDVYQQKQVVERVRAEIPLVEAQEQLLLYQMALLLGKPPRTELKIGRESLPLPTAVPGTGLPADLLSARPDVRAAGMRLQAADWQVAAARAERLPAISLTARATYGSGDLSLLFDNWLLSLAGNLTAPIFDANRRAAEVDRTRAVVDERLWAYRQVVLTAIKEVEDALVSEEKQRQHIQALTQQIDAARKALNEAGERYLKGLNDYLPVLTQLLSVQSLERDLIRREAELLIARVSLYRALGGSWMTELQPKEKAP